MFVSANDSFMRSIRKATAHAFPKNEVNCMNEVSRKYVSKWMNGRLQELCRTQETFDPAREFNLITFLIICEAAFEYEATEQEFEFFEHHSEIAVREFMGKSVFNPMRRIFGSFIPEVRRARDSSDALLVFCGKVLESYRQNQQKSSRNSLIKTLSENTSITNEHQRQSEVKDWLGGGHDTTGYSLSNALVLLAQHPEAQTKLREELRKVNLESNLCDCAYFHHVVKESMRVMPVGAGGSGRTTGKEFHTSDGKVVPAGALCLFNQYLMNHNEKVFDNPDTFSPERWENPTEEMKIAMAPFALGSRACPGQSLAMSQINCLLPRLLSQYFFEVVDEGEKQFFLTLKFLGARLKVAEACMLTLLDGVCPFMVWY